MNVTHKIFCINPGSTSTKLALFEDAEELFSLNVSHDASKLDEFTSISDQLPYRRDTILTALKQAGLSLNGVSAVVGRGGGLMATEGGTYIIDGKLLSDAVNGANGVRHPAQLGPQLANEFAIKHNAQAFVVNPPDTDELIETARYTGVKGMYRHVHLHALNLKETAIRHAAKQGKRYEECKYIVCHLGGGISISAHRNGRIVDGNDIVGGEGPMAPTRCGALPATELIDYCFSGVSKDEAKALCTKSGGFVSHLKTSDARSVSQRAADGDKDAMAVWDAMTYQICKYIGEMAVVLEGKAEGILLGGGLVHNTALVQAIEHACGWIAPVYSYPGEFEMEAMAAGALRVLTGEETAKMYTGIPVWQGLINE
jgi:butyrate kinase